jgi:hypothetical protein
MATETTVSGMATFYSDDCSGPGDTYGHKSYCHIRDGKVTDPPPGVQFFDRLAFEATLAKGETSGRCGWRWKLTTTH